MKILLVTDAWEPQVNGVVRTLQNVIRQCEKLGHVVNVISPDNFRSVPCPTYPEIRLALTVKSRVAKEIEKIAPDAIHIATEGPLGWNARSYCLSHNIPFTTSYHTRFPEYISARFPIPEKWGYWAMRLFHQPSNGVMVATPTIRQDLESKGFYNICNWTRGVDVSVFHPDVPRSLNIDGPVYLYVGRIAVEKNLEAFLELDLPGTKVLVGDGPQRAELEVKYPGAVFTGAKFGEELASHYASADVFVFPSKTDTFGLVMLEALACGVPVAAYPVAGPLDVIQQSGAGVLDHDLKKAVTFAHGISRDVARAHALTFSWEACALQFVENIERSLKRRRDPLISSADLALTT